MKSNMGAIDSWVRIFVGIWLVYGALTGLIGAIGYVGLVFLTTGLLRTCPAYGLFGINTNCCEASSEH